MNTRCEEPYKRDDILQKRPIIFKTHITHMWIRDVKTHITHRWLRLNTHITHLWRHVRVKIMWRMLVLAVVLYCDVWKVCVSKINMKLNSWIPQRVWARGGGKLFMCMHAHKRTHTNVIYIYILIYTLVCIYVCVYVYIYICHVGARLIHSCGCTRTQMLQKDWWG